MSRPFSLFVHQAAQRLLTFDSFTRTPGRLLKRKYSSVLQPSSERSTFIRQSAAIEYKGQDESQTIFALEYSKEGRRRFLVQSPEAFWEEYITEKNRHYYEVISKDSACKLYLDIEFKIEDNPDLIGEKIVDHLINQLNTFVNEKLEVDISKEDILLLDSTSQTKFSNHLIFTSLVFADNFQAGRFINDFLSSLSTDQIQKFQVKKGDDNVWIVDTAVYSKNRNFRLYLSSKYGRQEILDISANDLFSKNLIEENSEDPEFDKEKTIFLNSLVTLTTDISIIDYNSNMGSGLGVDKYGKGKRPSSSARLTEGANKSSPYPEIDKIIQRLIAPTGFIRKWTKAEYFYYPTTVTYEIGGNRFCGNIKREHKSNNIKYVCNLESGVINQRCHDPECREYRGPDIKIPEHLVIKSERAILYGE